MILVAYKNIHEQLYHRRNTGKNAAFYICGQKWDTRMYPTYIGAGHTTDTSQMRFCEVCFGFREYILIGAAKETPPEIVYIPPSGSPGDEKGL
jgi:hypothetical protein